MTIFTSRTVEREIDDPRDAALAVEDEYDHPLDWISDEMHALASEALYDPGNPTPRARCGWPPSDDWYRRLRAVVAEVEAAREVAHGDDPPDTGRNLGLEVRGG